jgi:hypothetical protein
MNADYIKRLRSDAADKTNFLTIEDYLAFAKRYLEYIADTARFQAQIVSRNEPHYHFIQYKVAGHYNVTRPLNTRLLQTYPAFERSAETFVHLLTAAREHTPTAAERELINKTIYTAQQAIGASLDALPAGASNTARKINGDLFERLIRLIISRLGVHCTAGTVQLPIVVEGEQPFTMSYQHDLIIKSGEFIKAIGSVKTSSKDRLDKIFIDKFLFNKLSGKDIPHVAIFLNDVQRKGVLPKFGISATFLPGHFKGYTVKLNPLDGVYYCDIRPNMLTEDILRDHIRTFDHFIFEDLWELLDRDAVVASIEQDEP